MHCKNCGSEIPAGSLFCIHCGERADAVLSASPAPQVQVAPPDAPYPYAPQPAAKKPLGKGKKALIFGGGGAVVLAVVLILIFTLSGGGGPLSGNTVQTRFVNENARFLAGMLDDFSTVDMSRMMSEPFEYTVEVSMESDGFSSNQEIAMAYDKQALGVTVDSDYSTMTLLLADALVVESNGYVQVIEFDTDADLDAAMSLKDRILALMDTGDVKVDYKKLIEMFVNSIPQDCFEKTGEQFVMTLEVDDLVDTLNAFAESLEEEKDIDEAFRDVIKEASGRSRNLSDLVQDAADQLDAVAGYVDFEIVWELAYEKGAPSALSISFEEASGYSDFTLDMEYENVSGGKDIEVSLESAGGYSDFTMEMTTTQTSGGLKLEGEARVSDQTVTFMGYQQWDGENFSIMADAESDGETASIKQEGTISFGMPDKDVQSDRRFDIDTDDAYYTDLFDLF